MSSLKPLFALPLALALVASAPRVFACEYQESCGGDDKSEADYRNDDAETGVGLTMFHRVGSSSDLTHTGQSSMWALDVEAHIRVSRRIALGFDLEQGGGSWNGYNRYELAWTLPTMYVYLTPESKFQLYTALGWDMRVAHFESGSSKQVPGDAPWGNFYMGTFLAGGVESRLSKGLALRFEIRGFVDGRLDGQLSTLQANHPEYSNDTKTYKGITLSVGTIFF